MAEREDSAPEAQPLPTVVLGGWLGAGKTTMLNSWLREAGGRRLAVLVNDFGDVSIDADLIVGADGDVISLAGGCICCAVGSDLFGALRRMTERHPRPDLLLVETSGVALPAAVARTVKLVPDIEVRAVVVLVDTLAWHDQVHDRYVADTVRQQVAEADLLVLTKTGASCGTPVEAASGPAGADLAATVRGALASIAPATPVLDAGVDAQALHQAVLDGAIETVASPQGEWLSPADLPRAGALRRAADAIGPAAGRFESRLEVFHRPIDPQDLVARWTAPGAGVVRAKGWVTGLDGRRLRVQIVGRRASVVVDDRAPPGDRVVVIRLRADGQVSC